MAFSATGDLGCEYGGGVSCHKNEPLVGTKGGPKQSFAGWMVYNRWWFKKDKYALTLGGGAFDNPGRYLTLLQPINGADAISGSPYFPEGPGLPFKAWDSTRVTFDYMPKQYITFLWEYRLSPRRRSLLHRPRRNHSAGRQQRRSKPVRMYGQHTCRKRVVAPHILCQ